MSQVTRANSKLKFQTGDVPTQSDFEDLHDSVTWYDESGSSPVVGEQKSEILVDQNDYSAFVSLAWTDNKDTIYAGWKASTTHAADGDLIFAKKTNGVWSAGVQISIGGSPATGGTIEIGYYNGRLFMTYTVGSSYAATKFAYSDDDGATWTAVSDVSATVGQDKVAPYGRMITLGGGKHLFPAYSWNTGTSTSTSFCYETSDNGATWSVGSTIHTSTIGGTFPTGGQIDETSIAVVSTDGTNAGTVLMALIRNENAFSYHQAYSTNGASTWTVISGDALGSQNTGTTTNKFPATLIADGDYVYALAGNRGGTNGHVLLLFKAPLATVYNDITKWGTATKLYRHTAGYKGEFPSDAGYWRGYINSAGEFKAVGYDTSVSHRTTTDNAAPRIRIVSIPIRGVNYYEAYNTSNQSISTGIETIVSTPTIWLDSEGAYNSGDTKIYFPNDGWYFVTARVTFDVSSEGEYRWAKLVMVDTGNEAGSGGGTGDEDSYYLIAKKAIPTSTITDFNHIELSGQIYAYEGMELRLTVKQDTGSSLNLLNTTKEGRSTIQFKKIN